MMFLSHLRTTAFDSRQISHLFRSYGKAIFRQIRRPVATATSGRGFKDGDNGLPSLVGLPLVCWFLVGAGKTTGQQAKEERQQQHIMTHL
jgi:hypothetical protein